jgi:hypothetical protein
VQARLVEVDDVEAVCLPDGGFQRQDLVGHPVFAIRIEAQCLPADRHQPGVRLGVAAREQRDIVSEFDETFGQVRDHTFGAAIEPRRHRLMQWSNLRDPH